MTAPTALLRHGSDVRTITDTDTERIEAHSHLIAKVISRYCPNITDDGYTYSDAWQDGWLGLAAAVQRHPDGPAFTAKARSSIWSSIRRGRGLHSGRNWRRRADTRTPHDRHNRRSLNAPVHSGDGWDELGATIPDTTAGTDTTAMAAIDLATAIDAGHRACTDHIDRAVLAWILNPLDARPAHELAQLYRRDPETIRQRRIRLISRMAKALAA